MKDLRFLTNEFTEPFIMKYKVDFRGRIYPQYSALSYIAHPIIRTMFEIRPTSEPDMELIRVRSLGIINKIMNSTHETLEDARAYIDNPVNLHDFTDYLPHVETCWFMLFFELNGYIPMMQLDGRCRGFQHFAGLINNEKIGRVLDLCRYWPAGDLYTEVYNE